jgi:S-DNA-T family DNA segregation ATPase FtsK/SpoIIIE
MQEESRREIFAFSILALSAFFWVCLITYHPADVLLARPGPAKNACGPAGAYVSHTAILWVGKLGAYGLAGGSALLGLAIFFRRRIQEPAWKLVGGALLILVLASLEVALDTPGGRDSLPGGYYGQFIHRFLLNHLSSFGTYLLLALTFLVALIVSTDAVLYPALARAGGAALDTDRWEAIGKRASRVFSAATSFPSLPIPRIAWRRRGTVSASGNGKGTSGRRAASNGSSGAQSAPEAKPGRTARAERSVEAPQEQPPAAPLDESGDDEDETEVGGQAPARVEPRPPLKIRVPEVRESPPRRKASERAKSGPYHLPPLDLIDAPAPATNSLDRTILEQTAAKIEETLMHFKIEARVVEVQKGPTITQYEVSLAAGIKVHKIMNLADDLAMALKAPSIRIVAPIPGKSTVGIEVPNKSRSMVGLRELLESAEFRDEDYKLPLALGKDVAGTPVIGDLGEMPHLLIAGSTGSGKSVCINSIIINLLLTRTPDEVKLILVDPKMVELAQFENIPHLLTPVVTDMKKAPAVLGWTVDKMEERYELLAMAGVRHILSYNALGREKLRERLEGKVDEAEIDEFPESLPFIVVIIDELADLMMTASKEVEASITRLSQKSRAVGIHVILATQRPSVDVITGLIKANMPSRISFHVASKVDSRTILDRNGAEKLLGKGDLLYLPPGTSALVRVQGTFISDREIRDVVKCVTQQAEPQFSPELTRFGIDGDGTGTEEDELYEDAVRTVLGSQRGSVTLLQRQLQIGYTRASRLMEIMHDNGLVGPFKGSKSREVYYTLEEWEQANAKRLSARKDQEQGAPEDDGDPAARESGAASDDEGS